MRGSAVRLAIVWGEAMFMKAMCSSSYTRADPFGDRLGEPSGRTVATKVSLAASTISRMSALIMLLVPLVSRTSVVGSERPGEVKSAYGQADACIEPMRVAPRHSRVQLDCLTARGDARSLEPGERRTARAHASHPRIGHEVVDVERPPPYGPT